MDFQKTKAEITPKELKERLDKGEDLIILDIREPQELSICKLKNTRHIPMGELAQRLNELEDYKNRDIVVYCRSGGRSGQCVHYMRQHGFNGALDLSGGILAWSDDVDPSVQKY